MQPIPEDAGMFSEDSQDFAGTIKYNRTWNRRATQVNERALDLKFSTECSHQMTDLTQPLSKSPTCHIIHHLSRFKASPSGLP